MIKGIVLGIKVVGLSVGWAVGYMFLAARLIPSSPDWVMTAEQQQQALVGLVLQAMINTTIVAFVILRSRWSGWQLTGAVFLLYYGATTVLSQMETVAFPAVANRLPPGFIAALVGMNALLSAVYVPMMVLVLGKWRRDPEADAANHRLEMPVVEWAWKLAVIVIAYQVLYFTFGYFVAWRTPAVQEYYGGTDPGSFFAQMGNVMRDAPWLPFFQALRALLWTAIALPVIRGFKGGALETGVAIGLAYAAFMNSGLLVPNPLMPDAVRTAHLIETATSNFIFGVLVGWLLSTPMHARRLSGRRLGSSVKL